MSLSDNNLTILGILITAIGSSASVIGIFLVWLQVRASQRSVKGEILLHLTDQLHDHSELYQLLRDSKWKPIPGDETMMTNIEAYLSVFEQDQVFISYGIIDLEVFVRLYSHRVMFIVLNDFTYKMLADHPEYWTDFIALAHTVARIIKKRSPLLSESDSWKRCIARIDKFSL